MRARLSMWLARRQRSKLAAWCAIADLTDGELYRAYRLRRNGVSGQYAGDRIRATRSWASRQRRPGLFAMDAVYSKGLRR